MNLGVIANKIAKMQPFQSFSTEIPGYGYMLHLAIPFFAWSFVLLIAGGGQEMFIPENWQTARLQTPEDIKNHIWIELRTRQFPIMIDGYPRTIK